MICCLGGQVGEAAEAGGVQEAPFPLHRCKHSETAMISYFWRADGTTSTIYLIPKCPLMAKNITGVKRSFGEPTHGQARRPSRGYEVPIKDHKVGKKLAR